MSCCLDLHVHTKRYSGCAEFLDPKEIGSRCIEVGLDGVVITDHDWLWQHAEIAEVARKCPEILFLRGMECSARGCHILLIGIDEMAPFSRGMEPEEVIGACHAQGGAAILAHPYRDSDPETLPCELFDAIEIDSTSFVEDTVTRSIRLAEMLALPVVANSDAHALSRIGWAWTEFPEKPQNEEELVEMICAGQGQPRLHEELMAQGMSQDQQEGKAFSLHQRKMR